MSNYTSTDDLILMTYASIKAIQRMWNIDALCVKEIEVLSLLIIHTPFGCEHSDKIIKGLYEDLNAAVGSRKQYLQRFEALNH